MLPYHTDIFTRWPLFVIFTRGRKTHHDGASVTQKVFTRPERSIQLNVTHTTNKQTNKQTMQKNFKKKLYDMFVGSNALWKCINECIVHVPIGQSSFFFHSLTS